MKLPRRYVRFGGCRFDASVLTPSAIRHLLGGSYEVQEQRALRLLDPELPLIELGGGFGVLACLANKRLKRPSDHVIVEANPHLLPILERHRELNGCRFEVLHRAIGYDADVATFFVCGNPLASSCVRPSPRPVQVETTTLTRVAERFDRMNVICDIEGAERQLVERESSVWERVQALVLELHEQVIGKAAVESTVGALQHQRGFRLLERTNDVAIFAH
jgi:FkbM family methyltransferase